MAHQAARAPRGDGLVHLDDAHAARVGIELDRLRARLEAAEAELARLRPPQRPGGAQETPRRILGGYGPAGRHDAHTARYLDAATSTLRLPGGRLPALMGGN